MDVGAILRATLGLRHSPQKAYVHVQKVRALFYEQFCSTYFGLFTYGRFWTDSRQQRSHSALGNCGLPRARGIVPLTANVCFGSRLC